MAESELPIGIEHLTVQDMRPDEFVDLAAKLGCASISLQAAINPRFNPFAFAHWSMVEDRALRRDVIRRMADAGIVLALGEGMRLSAGKDVRRFEAELDTFAELGAMRVSLLGMGTAERTFELEQTGRFSELAAARGMIVSIEFVPGGWVNCAADLAGMLAEISGPPATLLIDPMHFFRFGQQVASLADVPAARLAYLQLCDVPLSGSGPYFEEALYRRLVPGEGELPLESLVAALPDNIVLSLELPHVELTGSGVSHVERLRPAMARSRELVARAREQRGKA